LTEQEWGTSLLLETAAIAGDRMLMYSPARLLALVAFTCIAACLWGCASDTQQGLSVPTKAVWLEKKQDSSMIIVRRGADRYGSLQHADVRDGDSSVGSLGLNGELRWLRKPGEGTISIDEPWPWSEYDHVTANFKPSRVYYIHFSPRTGLSLTDVMSGFLE